jgi:hypothetical protein
MTLTTVSARDFVGDLAGAKRAAKDGPVIVTDRGRPRGLGLAPSQDQHPADAQRQ